jgi:TetR/AcrR family transcriptional regulator, transcriptional repressor for nem operon
MTKAAKQQTDTAEQILDLAETLIQTRSYSAFSYQDISDALGIRKASIHYHFASKAALGVAVVDRYTERFRVALTAMAQDQSKSSMEMLDFYFQPFLQFASTPDRVCLCGALAGEMLALPPEIRARVNRFFKDHQAWLAGILERGAKRGEFELPAAPAKTARLVFNALQGALIVKRTMGDASQLADVVTVLKAQLMPAKAKSRTRRGA